MESWVRWKAGGDGELGVMESYRELSVVGSY